MISKIFLAAVASASLLAMAAPASALNFVGTGTPTVQSSDPGLVLGTQNLNESFSFNLNQGDSTSVDLFTLYTNETSVDKDDTVPKAISVAFNFTAPVPGFSGSVDGTTQGNKILKGLFQDGSVTWDNGGVADFSFGNGGVLEVDLNDATFNTGLFGLNHGSKHGAVITGEFSLISAPSAAPEPAAWVLMFAGVGLAGAALRRRRSAGLSFTAA